MPPEEVHGEGLPVLGLAAAERALDAAAGEVDLPHVGAGRHQRLEDGAAYPALAAALAQHRHVGAERVALRLCNAGREDGFGISEPDKMEPQPQPRPHSKQHSNVEGQAIRI